MSLPEPYYSDELLTLYHGNALELIHEIDGVDCVLTDPPYSSGGAMRSDRMTSTVAKYVSSGTRTYRPEFSGDNRDQRAYFAWSSLWMCFALAASKSGAHILCFTDWRQLPVTVDAIQSGGWCWRGLGTWWKPGIRMQLGGLSSSAEYVVWGTAGEADIGAEADNRYAPQNVFRAAPVKDKTHIAEKPESVVEWLLPLCPAGGLILDPFVGHGTVLQVARKLGRRAIGIEIDEQHCAATVEKLKQSVLPGLHEPQS